MKNESRECWKLVIILVIILVIMLVIIFGYYVGYFFVTFWLLHMIYSFPITLLLFLFFAHIVSSLSSSILVKNYVPGLHVGRIYASAASVGSFICVAGGVHADQFHATAEILDTTSGLWKTSALRQERSFAAAAGLAGIFFVIVGGVVHPNAPDYLASAEVYNVITGEWLYFENALSSGCSNLAVAAYGSVAAFVGGQPFASCSSKITAFNASGNTWSDAGNLSIARTGLASVAVGSIGYFAGGTDNWSWWNITDTYDFLTGRLSRLDIGLSYPRAGCIALGVDSILLVGGGITNYGSPVAIIDIYDTIAGAWTTNSLSRARLGMTGSTLGKKAIWAGGADGSDAGAISTIDIYDVTTQTLTTSALSSLRDEAVSASVGSLMVVMGGYSPPIIWSNTVDYLIAFSDDISASIASIEATS